MSTASRRLDRIEATFDSPAVVPNAWLLLAATLISRLGLEELVNSVVRLGDREGAVLAGRKLLTLVCARLLRVQPTPAAGAPQNPPRADNPTPAKPASGDAPTNTDQTLRPSQPPADTSTSTTTPAGRWIEAR